MNSEKINDLKICLKSIIICYIPNAIPVSRIVKLTGFILDDKDAELLKSYGVQKFVQKYMIGIVAVLKDGGGGEDSLIHVRCQDGEA